MSKKKKQITLSGESVEIVDRLCEVTGLTPRHVVALLLRRYGRELESWMGVRAPAPPTPTPSLPSNANSHEEPTLELPSDPGASLGPIQL